MTTRTVSPNGQTNTADLPANPFGEVGYPQVHHGGVLYQDFLRQLRGTQALKVWREMADNDATVGSLLFAVEQLVRQVEWDVVPGDDTPQAAEWADFLETCVDDMSHTWPDFVAEVTTMIPYGWAWFETVYKRRLGDAGDTMSRYDDGRIGWRKHAYRSQDTLSDFDMDEHGGVRGMWQISKGGQPRVYLPIEKSLLFRTTTARPLGKSWLRNAYRSWFFKKRAEEISMVGLDRDLTGIPTARIPVEHILAQDDLYKATKKLTTRTKVDEQQGIVFPRAFDENGNSLYELEMMSGPGGRPKVDPIGLIRMFALDILGSVLAHFIALGRDAVGSRALAEPQQELFRTGLGALLAMVGEVVNRHGVSRLMRLNGVPTELWPRLEPGEIKDVDLGALAEFVLKTSQAGVPWVTGDEETDRETFNQVRGVAGFPPLPADLPADVDLNPQPIPSPSDEDEVPVGKAAAVPRGVRWTGTHWEPVL